MSIFVRQTVANYIESHAILLFIYGWGSFILLPWLAPVFMWLGFERLGNLIYSLYSIVCHQLPNRSIFLFGDEFMYSLNEIQTHYMASTNLFVVRQFTGNEILGWKLAWSDRMISLYGGVWVFTILWLSFSKNKRPKIHWGICFLLLIPMIVDGITHSINDLLFGIDAGFRYDNVWLANLTQGKFANEFYQGDQFGSFNSWVRWISGYSFSFGLMWWVLPNLQHPVNPSL